MPEQFMLWAANYCRRQAWRLNGQFDLDDLAQESWLVYRKVSRKYADVSEHHLMSLYKTSLARHVHSLCRKTRRWGAEINGYDLHDDIDYLAPADPAGNHEGISDLLSDAERAGKVIYDAMTYVIAHGMPRAAYVHASDTALDAALSLPPKTCAASQLRKFIESRAYISDDNSPIPTGISTMSNVNVTTELVAATRVDAQTIAQEDFYLELITRADGLPDDEYKQLSAGAQKWINDATLAANSDEPVPPLDLTGIIFSDGAAAAPPAQKETPPPAAEPAAPKAVDAPPAKEHGDKPLLPPTKPKPAAKRTAPLRAGGKRVRNVFGVGTSGRAIMEEIVKSKGMMTAADAVEVVRDGGERQVSILTADAAFVGLTRAIGILRGMSREQVEEIAVNLEKQHPTNGKS